MIDELAEHLREATNKLLSLKIQEFIRNQINQIIYGPLARTIRKPLLCYSCQNIEK